MSEKIAQIALEKMEFVANHGCLEHEKKYGNTFSVDLWMDIDCEIAAKTDQLSDALNYQEVYDVVKREMEIASELIEHVGHRITSSVFTHFPKIKKLKLKLSKHQPALGGKVGTVSVTYKMSR